MQMADARARKSDVAPGPAVALPLEAADDPAAVWVGVEDCPAADDGVSEGEDASVGAASDEPSRRLQAGLVVLPVEKNMVAKPANVGASLEDAAIEEAQAVQRADGGRAMRKRGHVNYRKERIGMAGLIFKLKLNLSLNLNLNFGPREREKLFCSNFAAIAHSRTGTP